MKCINCGKEIPDGSQFCNHCGKEQIQENKNQIEKAQDVSEPIRRPISMKMIVAGAVVGIAIIASVITIPKIQHQTNYKNALSAVENGQFDEADRYYRKIDDCSVAEASDYYRALVKAYCEENDFENARMAYKCFPSSVTAEVVNLHREECTPYINYQEALYLEKIHQYADAYIAFIKCGDYEDSVSHAENIISEHTDFLYQVAINNYESGTSANLSLAKSQFELFPDYERSQEYIDDIDFLQSLAGTYKDRSIKFVIDDTGNVHRYDPESTVYVYKRIESFEGHTCLLIKKDRSIKLSTILYLDDDGDLRFTYVYDRQDGIEYAYTDKKVYSARKESDSMALIKEPSIGMTAEQVRNSVWGEPNKINKTTYSWGTSEQWCYSGYRYIYLDNGVVTAIQE